MARVKMPSTAFSNSLGKRKRPRVTDEQHLKFIRSLPSVLSGKRGCQACHIRYQDLSVGKRETGKQEKPADHWTIPLTPDEHASQHRSNEKEWWEAKGIDPLKVASALHLYSGDDELCETILREAREGAKQ